MNELLTLPLPLWLPPDAVAAVDSMGPRSFPVHPSALSLADRESNPSALCLPIEEISLQNYPLILLKEILLSENIIYHLIPYITYLFTY